MRVESVELHHLRLPLRTPWHTAHGSLAHRDLLLVEVRSDEGVGWGECAAFADPFYSPETLDTARIIIEQYLAPALTRPTGTGTVTAAGARDRFSFVAGHHMARSALEMALLDIELRSAGQSFAAYLGVTRTEVPAGVAIGFQDDVAQLVDSVAAFVAAGYRRVKVKIEPGRDVEPLAALRDQFATLELLADANGAYAADGDHHDATGRLRALDEFGLVCLEQPLGADDLVGHRRLAEAISTPVCLDESLRSLDEVRTALQLRACSVVNLKPGRVGGYLEAVRIHDHCQETGVALWCGGMLESGLARAANVALAALDGFSVTGDLSAGERFYLDDVVTEPVAMDDGRLIVPTGPGFGVDIDSDALDRFTVI